MPMRTCVVWCVVISVRWCSPCYVGVEICFHHLCTYLETPCAAARDRGARGIRSESAVVDLVPELSQQLKTSPSFVRITQKRCRRVEENKLFGMRILKLQTGMVSEGQCVHNSGPPGRVFDRPDVYHCIDNTFLSTLSSSASHSRWRSRTRSQKSSPSRCRRPRRPPADRPRPRRRR